MQYIVQFFSWIMDWCYQVVPNHWADIIIFTFITKILQYPLSLWCHVNSLKMVAIMPQSIRIKMDHFGDSEKIGEESAALFKREHYHPLLSLIPLAIQIVILMGFVKVIYGIAAAEKGSMIGMIPVQDGGIAWVMPLLAGAAAWLLGWCQNRISPLQREQSRAQQMTTNGISIAISLFLGCFVGMGVGLYWAASNLFSILVQLCCNITIIPTRHINYPELRKAQAELKKLEDSLKRPVSKEDARRERADYQRFFKVANKHLVFYAEGGGYYKYFQSIIEWLLVHSNVVIHYVTNDPMDGVFKPSTFNLAPEEYTKRIRAYYIGQRRIIPLMMKMDADIIVMTTPDLGQYHIKRSYVRKDIEYIYLCHGPTSVHMCTRKGAYDNFDTVFSNGEYQSKEFRALEKLDNLKTKHIVPTGYVYFDTLFKNYTPKPASTVKRIMIAPSYQEANVLDSCLDELIASLRKASAGEGQLTIVVRPHPQYVRRTPAKMAAICERYAGQPDVVFETDFSKPSTMNDSDVLVTDWSGIACEFSFMTGKPCIFIDTPMKVINPDYKKIDLVPTEISFRNRLGRSFALDEIGKVTATVSDMLANPQTYAAEIRNVLETMYYNPGHSGEVAGSYIIDSLITRKKGKTK